MKNNPKSKYEIMVRLPKNTNAYQLALENGFVQMRNGIELPNTNALMNTLYLFAESLYQQGISIKFLVEEDVIKKIIEVISHE